MPKRKEQLNCSTVDEMNTELIKRHNNKVSKDSLVIYLGDVVMGKKFENVPKIISQLNGIKFLLRGNHDAGFQDTRPGKLEEANTMYRNNGFDLVLDGLVNLNQLLEDCGVTKPLPYHINMCHFPYKGTPDHDDPNGYEARYIDLMPKFSDSILLHGHTHSEKVYQAKNMIHVGVDCSLWNYSPVNLIEILNTIKAQA